MNIPLSPCVPENLARETGSAVPSRVSLLISILRLNLVLTYGIAPEFRGGVHMKPPYAIGSVPSLSGHAIVYRWRSLPRVRRHRASKPQGSFERVLPWQITMDQLIFASLSHTHHWYEVGMLEVPAYMCVCFLPIHSGHQVRWTYQPGSHRRKVTQDFSSTFFLRCVPSFFSREGFSHSFPSSTVKSNFVY